MLKQLRSKLDQWQKMLLISSTVAGLVVVTSLTGIFNPLELLVFDQFFRWRSPEEIDQRIVIITIGETDIKTLQKWPLSDAQLVELIEKVKLGNPRVIGLNIFRDFPIEPGHQALKNLFKTTPNLIGIEKIIGNTIQPSPILSELNQIGFVDLVLDGDGKVRRDLISMSPDNEIQKLSFGMVSALTYLDKKGINAQLGNANKQEIVIGNAHLFPLSSNAGSYVNIDNGGYQILLNYRGDEKRFQTISILDVLNNQYPQNLFDDRLVLIGVTAESISKSFFTPYNHGYPTSGTMIYANSISQILGAALDDRKLLNTWPDRWEWLWILGWSLAGGIVTHNLLIKNIFKYNSIIKWGLFGVSNGLLGLTTIGGSYLLFLQGWWIPTITPVVAIISVSVLIIVDEWQYLATVDSLTQIPNRLYFDKVLQQIGFLSHLNSSQISLILCDVDHFKQYNDTYGHPLGDRCLKKVAKAIAQAVRRTDFVARYGGEEFAVILPNTDTEEAIKVAQRMLSQVSALKIPHETSSASNYVTISCGISSIFVSYQGFTEILIEQADKALYHAKKQGRNQAIIYNSMMAI